MAVPAAPMVPALKHSVLYILHFEQAGFTSASILVQLLALKKKKPSPNLMRYQPYSKCSFLFSC